MKVLKEIRKKIEIDKLTKTYLESETKNVVGALNDEIKERAEIFVGGSYAKGTLLERENYDIDIYVRFGLKNDNISEILDNITKKISKKVNMRITRVHGSRDYFRMEKERNLVFEIIPVYNIKNPKQAKNVTDLSYFHVNYVKKKLRGNEIKKEILIAKKFCQAFEVYGAEDYIRGFSGYGLECLIINYGSFLKMLRALIKVKDRLVLDPAKLYKNTNDVLFSLNESKLQSPVILVDPTWKERNALSALSRETFEKFQVAARNFLEKQSLDFFETTEFDVEKLKKLKGEFIQLKISTNRQEGDIAGTKMKKFSKFLEMVLKRYFEIIKAEFRYDGGQFSDFYLVIKSKKEIIKLGPPITLKKHAVEFKKKNDNVYVKKGYLYSRRKINFSGESFLKTYIKMEKRKLNEMGIVGVRVRE